MVILLPSISLKDISSFNIDNVFLKFHSILLFNHFFSNFLLENVL